MAIAKPAQLLKGNQKNKLYWLLTIGFAAIIMLLPNSAILTMQIKLFFAMTIFCILLLAFELTDNIVPSILLPIGYIIFNLAKPAVVFQPWTTQIPSLLIGAFILTAIMEQTGLSKRIAYWCLLKTGGTYKGIFVGAFFAGLILALAMPGAIGRGVLFGAIMLGICKALNFEAGSKQAAGLFIMSYLASSAVGGMIFTSSSANMLMVGFLQPYGVEINFMNWLHYLTLPSLIWTIVSIILILVLFKDNSNTKPKEYFKQQYQALGQSSKQEKSLLLIILLTVVLLMTGSIHKIQPGFILALAGLICFFPGVNLANQETIKKINFVMVFLTVGMISIGNVSMEIGAGQLIAAKMLPLMPESVSLATLLIYVVVYIGNFLLTPLALISGLLTPIIELGIHIGMQPTGTAFLFGACSSNILMPHEITSALVMYSFGMIAMKDFMKYFAIRSLLFIPIVLFVDIPWYHFLGIL